MSARWQVRPAADNLVRPRREANRSPLVSSNEGGRSLPAQRCQIVSDSL